MTELTQKYYDMLREAVQNIELKEMATTTSSCDQQEAELAVKDYVSEMTNKELEEYMNEQGLHL